MAKKRRKKMGTLLVAGLPQSGSTLLFNILRLTTQIGRLGYKATKTHGYDAKMHKEAAHIFLPMRDLRDIIASTKAKNPEFKNGNVIEIGKNHIRWHKKWIDYCDYIWSYEKYKQDPLKIITEIQEKVLKRKPFQVEHIYKSAESLKDSPNIPPAQIPKYTNGGGIHANFWKKTKLSKTHITNQGKIGDYTNRLTQAEILLIEKNFGYFLKEYGYDLIGTSTSEGSQEETT